MFNPLTTTWTPESILLSNFFLEKLWIRFSSTKYHEYGFQKILRCVHFFLYQTAAKSKNSNFFSTFFLLQYFLVGVGRATKPKFSEKFQATFAFSYGMHATRMCVDIFHTFAANRNFTLLFSNLGLLITNLVSDLRISQRASKA